MKHVVTAAPRHRRVLVTGFGAFPGAPRNPSAEILRRLARQTGRLARLGIELRCVLIPVAYRDIEPTLARAVAVHRPDAILHLGLASRRRQISIETRAINRAGPLHPGADGHLPAHQILSKGGPQSLRATYPAARILAAIRRTGLAASRSNDAGDYVCNATLYRSLLGRIAPHIGFLHVPRVQRAAQPKLKVRTVQPTIEALTLATLGAILVMARPQPARVWAAATSAPMAPPTGGVSEGR